MIQLQLSLILLLTILIIMVCIKNKKENFIDLLGREAAEYSEYDSSVYRPQNWIPGYTFTEDTLQSSMA